MTMVMPYQIFRVSLSAPAAAQVELNGFMRSHRVLSVERRWVEQGEGSYWAFCVDYLESSGAPAPAPAPKEAGVRNRVDYRELLTPADFAVFARLREIRK